MRVINNGTLLPSPFVSVNADTAGERGLLGIAFDPNFPTNRYVYVYYTHNASPDKNRVSRFTADAANPDVAEPGSEVVILDDIGADTGFHNGGAVHFGSDGKLYIGVGDGGATSSNSQSLSTLSGKLLRINPDGSIPTDNPYVGTPGVRAEIWALGLRNPFTFAVDPVTGKIYVNDVGQQTWEEINLGVIGANYGWPTCEGPQNTGVGSCDNPAFTYPIHAYDHNVGDAITGGAFYRGSQFPSEFYGSYFFADYLNGWIKRLDTNNQVFDFLAANSPVDLKVGPDGSLYYASIFTGTIRRIEFATDNRAPAAVISADPTSGSPPLTVNLSGSGSSDPDGDPLSYSWDFGDGSPAESGATVSHIYQNSGPYTATLTVSDGRGAAGTATQRVTVGIPPVATILTPEANPLYNAGDTISFSGSGSDAEDGNLPASAFSWTIVFHHQDHTHSFLGPINAVTSGSFQIPQTGENSTNVFYRIHLTVTDSSGLTNEAARDILPRKSTLTLGTNISGLMLTLDGQPAVAVVTSESVVGFIRTIGAPSPQTIAGRTFEFVSWSDSGTQTHTITTPATITTYTATYREVTVPPPDPVPSAGLVGQWSFDEGFGTSANDGSGSGNNGTLVNDPTWMTGASCKVGGCLSFDGTNDYVRIGNSPLLQVTGDLTLSLWIKPAQLSTRQVLVDKGYYLEYKIGYISEADPRHPAKWSHGNGSRGESFSAIPSIEINQWQHIVVVRNSATRQINAYKNGVLVGTFSYTRDPVAGTLDLYLARRADSVSEYFNGLMDEVCIYNRVLSDAEITTLFNHSATGIH